MNIKNIFVGLFFAFLSLQLNAQTKRILPLPAPDLTCVSSDGLWKLYLNTDLGIIRVSDNVKKELSHKVTGLRNDSTKKIVRLYNYEGENNLPKGIVFEADLRKSGENAFGVDDEAGNRTTYSCAK